MFHLVAVQAVNWHDNSGMLFWHERAAFHRSVFGRSSAGNDVVATIFLIPGVDMAEGKIVGSSQRAGARVYKVQTSQYSAAGVTGKKTGSGENSVQ